jgi:hypothetical protein
VFGQSALGQGIEFALAFVLLDLGVPLGLRAFVQPGTDARHLIGWQRGKGRCDFLDGTHGKSSIKAAVFVLF